MIVISMWGMRFCLVDYGFELLTAIGPKQILTVSCRLPKNLLPKIHPLLEWETLRFAERLHKIYSYKQSYQHVYKKISIAQISTEF